MLDTSLPTAQMAPATFAARGATSPAHRARTHGMPAAMPLGLGLPVLGWQLLFFATPLVYLVVITFWQVKSFRLEPAFVLDNWARILGAGTFHNALLYTLKVAAVTTGLSMLIALPVAYTIALRLPARLRNLAVALLVVPVFSSYLLRIYAWQIVLSPQGLINSVLAWLGVDALPLLGGAFSLYVGLLSLTLPVVILVLVFAISGVDGTLIEAAENLGCRRSRVIAHVLLPAIRPALVLGASTAFLLAFGDYVSPVFMTGSSPPTLSILIVDTVKSGSQWPRASVIGVAMLTCLALVFVGARLMTTRRTGFAAKEAP
jgi:spermidine/putrescine transport system permease protein